MPAKHQPESDSSPDTSPARHANDDIPSDLDLADEDAFEINFPDRHSDDDLAAIDYVSDEEKMAAAKKKKKKSGIAQRITPRGKKKELYNVHEDKRAFSFLMDDTRTGSLAPHVDNKWQHYMPAVKRVFQNVRRRLDLYAPAHRLRVLRASANVK